MICTYLIKEPHPTRHMSLTGSGALEYPIYRRPSDPKVLGNGCSTVTLVS
jgi:hypothetical protein